MLKQKRNRRAYKKAAATGRRVCCIFAPGGKPIYFTVPEDASDADIDLYAFEARHGRPPTPVENTLRALAEKRASKEVVA